MFSHSLTIKLSLNLSQKVIFTLVNSEKEQKSKKALLDLKTVIMDMFMKDNGRMIKGAVMEEQCGIMVHTTLECGIITDNMAKERKFLLPVRLMKECGSLVNSRNEPTEWCNGENTVSMEILGLG